MNNFSLGLVFMFSMLYITPALALSSAQLDALIPTIIAAESSGNPKAVGDGGKARGLCQIQKSTWERFSNYSWDYAFDSEKNVHVGRHILEYINDKYLKNSPKQADMAHIIFSYNTGRYRFGDIPLLIKNHPNKIYRSIFKEYRNGL